jgi:hypothetical protein
MFNNNIPSTLAALVGTADLLIASDEKEQAANVLAFVIQHPETSTPTRQRAEDLFDDLEAELCPRVIWDARENARTLSLEIVLFDLEGML